jgi:hypothetical protein
MVAPTIMPPQEGGVGTGCGHGTLIAPRTALRLLIVTERIPVVVNVAETLAVGMTTCRGGTLLALGWSGVGVAVVEPVTPVCSVCVTIPADVWEIVNEMAGRKIEVRGAGANAAKISSMPRSAFMYACDRVKVLFSI